MGNQNFLTPDDARELSQMYHASAKDMDTMDLDAFDTELDNVGKMTEHDKFDMSRMNKKQEMRRVFRQFSILSFTCVIMGTWEFLLTANSQGLQNGGLAGLFWSYMWTLVGFGLIIASMAEYVRYHLWSDFDADCLQDGLNGTNVRCF